MIKEAVYAGIERRAQGRLSAEIKFKYKILSPYEGADLTQSAVTKNISCAGLCFESPSQIPLDTEISVVLTLPAAVPKTIEAKAKVIRIERLSPSLFDIGLVFTEMKAAERDEIKRCVERMDILRLLARVDKKEISDLHLTVNSPPMVRCAGQIRPLDNESLSAEEIRQMIYSLLSEEQKKAFEINKDLDFAFSASLNLRYRVSIYQQRGVAEVVFRHIMPAMRTRKELGLPDVIEDLCSLKEGLIIIGGTTGSGKSTTIATMIDIINRIRGGVVLSLEKPIEYLHKNIKSIVKQREVGVDVSSFAAGLKTSLRQDPDVIIVGEVLDSDTIETVLEAAETGHLVITSLHAADIVQVFDRVATFFISGQQNFIYNRLSHCLQAVIVQSLLPHKDGIGRVLSTEVCIATTAVKRIIRSADFTPLTSVIQTGSQFKMHLMQDSLDELFGRGLISAETYEMYSKK